MRIAVFVASRIGVSGAALVTGVSERTCFNSGLPGRGASPISPRAAPASDAEEGNARRRDIIQYKNSRGRRRPFVYQLNQLPGATC